MVILVNMPSLQVQYLGKIVKTAFVIVRVSYQVNGPLSLLL